MRKNKIIEFRITEDDYNKLIIESNIYGININELARRKVLLSNINIDPRIFYTMCGIYDLFEIPQDNWNNEMERNYKEGMKYLYDVLKNSK